MKRIDVVLYNEYGMEIARETVTETRTESDIIKGWTIYPGDSIKIQEV